MRRDLLPLVVVACVFVMHEVGDPSNSYCRHVPISVGGEKESPTLHLDREDVSTMSFE